MTTPRRETQQRDNDDDDDAATRGAPLRPPVRVGARVEAVGARRTFNGEFVVAERIRPVPVLPRDAFDEPAEKRRE